MILYKAYELQNSLQNTVTTATARIGEEKKKCEVNEVLN